MTAVKTYILFLIIFLTFSTSYCQSIEPLDLAKKIFGKEKFSNIKKYISGEYKGKPNGQDLQKNSLLKFNLLEQSENQAVVAMTILDSTTTSGMDAYLFFKKDNVWKMDAFRGLAMTGMIQQIKVELEKMSTTQINEIIEESKKSTESDFKMFSSIEEYRFELENAKLTLELDDNIISHFLKNESEFERIKEAAFKELENKNTDDERGIKFDNLKNECQKIFISSLSYGGYELGNRCLKFLIGGMLDNTVGYFYIKDKKDLPTMNSNRIIMVREIGNGWYIFKTT